MVRNIPIAPILLLAEEGGTYHDIVPAGWDPAS